MLLKCLYWFLMLSLVFSSQEEVKFPSRLTESAKLLLAALLQKDPAKR